MLDIQISLVSYLFALVKNKSLDYLRHKVIADEYKQELSAKLTALELLNYSFTSDEEIEQIWNNKDTINGIDTVLILIYTGMRINELLQIENAKINFEERYMIGGEKTEAGKDRVIPISKKILPLIKARYNPDNKYLITDEQGKPISYYAYKKYIWEPVMEQLNLPNPHTPHTTRHTTATMLSNARRENGEPVDFLTIKYILGHKTDTDITERYTHRRIEQLVAAIDLI